MTEFSPVFLLPEEVAFLQEAIGRVPEAGEMARAGLLARAEEDFAREWRLPAPGVSDGVLFCDPATGTPFVYDPAKRGSYSTPEGKVFSGPNHDRAWDAITHNRNANTARRCALGGLLTGCGEWLEKAKAIAFGYAEAYPDYPPNGVLSATWGRLFHQALDESVWSLSLLWAVECLWHAKRLTEAELAFLRDRLFLPIADLVWGEWYFIHNIRMWHNASIGCIGLAFRERSLVRRAIHGERGFRQQLVDGYRWKDGFSCEGSLAYHGYGMMAMLFLAEAMKRNGYDPYRDKHLLTALLVPCRMLQPDNTPPALGDLVKPKSLPIRLYATAARHYPAHEEMQAAASLAFAQWRELGCGADFETALWNDTTAYYGRMETDWILAGKPPSLPRRASSQPLVFNESGIAILRPQAEAWLLLKASGQTGSHDHFDRLSFVWWENGLCWFDDPGTCYYAHPFHEGWFKHTAAHNTALADHCRQEKCAARIVSNSGEAVDARVAPYPETMPDVWMHRQLTRLPGGWRDTFTATAARARTVDLLFHPVAEWDPGVSLPANGVAGEFAVSGLAGEAVAGVVQYCLPRPPFSLQFLKGGWRLELRLTAYPEGALLLVGAAPSNPQDHRVLHPFLCLRATGAEVVFETEMRVEPAALD